MFAKLSTLLALAVPAFSTFVIQTPTNFTSGGDALVVWNFDNGDPSLFSMELANAAFHNSFAIASNIQTSLTQAFLTLPIVPAGDGYVLQFVNVTDINQVYAQTPDFSVAPTNITSSSAASSSTSGASSSSGPAPTASTVTPNLPSSSASSTSPASSSGSSSGSGSSSASTPTGSAFNTGAAVALGFSGSNMVSVAVALVGAVVGAGVMGF